MKPNPHRNPSKPASENRAMPQPQNPAAPRPTMQQQQAPPHAARIPAQLITSGARLSLSSNTPLSQQIIQTTPLVQASRMAGPHLVMNQNLQIPQKLSVAKADQTVHAVNIGPSDAPVTSGGHITHLLSSSSLVAPLGQHVTLNQPQRVTIQTMGQAQNPVSTQPATLTLAQASNTQAGIAHAQHVGIVPNQMASIICSKGPRLGNQPTQLLQAFPSPMPRAAGKTIGGNIIRATSHTSTTPQPTVLSHFPARGQVITPIRTATISNRPNSPAVPHSAGLSITVPTSQLTVTDQKLRTLTAAPGVEINVQGNRPLHETRPVISHSGATKTIQLSQQPHAGGHRFVMATTAMPAGSHASITVAITKPIASHIVAGALLPSNVTTVTSAPMTTSTVPITKVTPHRLAQITQQPPQAQAPAQPVVHGAPPTQQHDPPASSHSGTTLHVPTRPTATNLVTTTSATSTDTQSKPAEPRSVGQMIQYSIAGFESGHYPNLSHFQMGATSAPGTAVRPTLVTAQPATVAPVSLPTSIGQTRLNQVVVMDPSRQIQVRTTPGPAPVAATLQTVQIPLQHSQIQPSSPAHVPQSPSSGTPSASPRPSILRKRTNEGFPVVSKKALPFSMETTPRQEQVSSPKQVSLENREASQSSTDTASSHDGSTNSTPTAHELNVKIENTEEESLPSLLLRDGTSSVEASPRKKPRKQLLQANQELKDEIVNSTSSEDETEVRDVEPEIKEEIQEEIKDEHIDEEGVRWVAFRKRPDFTLMNQYSCTWKTKNNHFLRYTDVRPKDERRPTVNELSNQKHIQQKSSGWKLFHLAAQLDDLMSLEGEVKEQMAGLQSELAPDAQRGQYGSVVDDVVMIHELTQANIQRSQLIVDQMKEARQNMINILEHKKKIDEIVSKHRSRRPVKSKARM